MGRPSLWLLLGLTFLAVSLHDVQVSAEVGPTESECRPYIDKAIHELKSSDTPSAADSTEGVDSQEKVDDDPGEEGASEEDTTPGDSKETATDDDGDDGNDNSQEEKATAVDDQSEEKQEDGGKSEETADDKDKSKENADDDDDNDDDDEDKKTEDTDDDDQKSEEKDDDKASAEAAADDSKEQADDDKIAEDGDDDDTKSGEDDGQPDKDVKDGDDDDDGGSKENDDGVNSAEAAKDDDDDQNDSAEQKDTDQSAEESADVSAEQKADEDNDDDDTNKSGEKGDQADDDESGEKQKSKEAADGNADDEESKEEIEETVKSRERRELGKEPNKGKDASEEKADDDDDDNDDKKESEEDEKTETASKEDKADDAEDDDDDDDSKAKGKDKDDDGSKEDDDDEDGSEETQPEDDLLLEGEIPENLRDRTHITELLHLDDEHEAKENAVNRVADIILRDLKRIYENAIKPLEVLYKYRDLSNRHFGDPEIFSKPLILFMGPWSGGKSTIINYLTGNEYTVNSLRTGAEPSPAYFNILMHGNVPEVLDGTQLAADWTFSGLQKFGQGLEDRLRGLKLPNKFLEKVNIVEIPGILEVRKQVSRLFPFNDACQWFIDRADIIFLVYDPAKLDVGPETEAILDQLKGREYQTRIVLNKADQVKPEELLRVQSALIWNISPLMSSAQPPTMYTTSLWSHPYETSSPVRLLQAQERAFLRDIRSAVDKRIENKIASARRFAVRVRNHAKMVDCYLTTYYNHKTLFGNKKRIADQIIENPQNYHIYEGLSTLTNISRYDLPDPEVYRDFFRLNPLYEFKKLSETCTYFRGCPINKLDVAIAYDLPELVGKYKKMAEQALAGVENDTDKSKS